jgi:succinate-semialdehyde dehydrogenase/glutarate-semialdehyde dehydrogenase
LHALMLAHADDLGHLVVFEQGRSMREAHDEIGYAASFVRWYAEECERTGGYLIPAPQARWRQEVLQCPVGPVAAVTPWNAPCSMVTRKLAPALAAGCTVIVKPSEWTPFSALALAVLCERAGIPPGVVQVLTGDAITLGEHLLASTKMRKLTFTGSTGVGKHLAKVALSTVKRISLEMGGNAPFIVCEDADMATAVAAALVAKFRVGGQSCIAGNRFLVHATRLDEFIDRFGIAMRDIVMGDGLHGGELGPLLRKADVDRLKAWLRSSLQDGATLLLGGNVVHDRFLEPTLVCGATKEPGCELFGPVVHLATFDSDEEAIAAANAGDAGLAAYVVSTSERRAARYVACLDVGMVGVNTGFVSDAAIPFGGMKASGLGREGGRAGLDAYIELKYVRSVHHA